MLTSTLQNYLRRFGFRSKSGHSIRHVGWEKPLELFCHESDCHVFSIQIYRTSSEMVTPVNASWPESITQTVNRFISLATPVEDGDVCLSWVVPKTITGKPTVSCWMPGRGDVPLNREGEAIARSVLVRETPLCVFKDWLIDHEV